MTTFLLIPGLLSDARVWEPLAAALTERGPVLHADVTRDDDIRQMAARLLNENEGDLILIGHSMGGRVAMDMAHQAKQRIRALILANTGHKPLQEGELPKRLAKIDLGHRDIDQLAREWLPPMLAPGREKDEALFDDLVQMVVSTGSDIHERQIRALVGRPDATSCLPNFGMPILLVTGAQDSWSPELQHREIASLAPNAEVHVIDGSGHFLPVEQPEKLIAVTNDWLDRHGFGINPNKMITP